MTHTLTRLAGLAVMLATLTLAPPAIAANSSAQVRKADAKQFAKLCASKAKRGRPDACVGAMKKLAAGKSSSPRSACARLTQKRVKAERKSAFARCVIAGAKLMKERKTAGRNAAKTADEQVDEEVDDPDAPWADEPSDEPLDDALDGALDEPIDPLD